jgi:hypothetical protein
MHGCQAKKKKPEKEYIAHIQKASLILLLHISKSDICRYFSSSPFLSWFFLPSSAGGRWWERLDTAGHPTGAGHSEGVALNKHV